MDQKPKPIQIKATDEKLKGEYSNFVQISHTQNEVMFDFISISAANGIFPAMGDLKQRIIITPGLFKRMIDEMKKILTVHESRFGTVTPSEAPTTNPIGFTDKKEDD